MLAKLFRNTYPFHYILFVLIAVIYQLPYLLNFDNLNFTAPQTSSQLWQLISSINPAILIGISFVVMFICMLITIWTSQSNMLVSKTSSLSATIFAILFSCRMVTPELFASSLILICLYRIMDSVNEQSFRELDFLSASVMVGIANLITPNAIIYFIVIFSSIFILRNFKFRYLILIILGYMLPISIYTAIYYFVNNSFTFWTTLLPNISLSFDIINIATNFDLKNIGIMSYYILLLLIALITIFSTSIKSNNMSLIIRDKYYLLIVNIIILFFASFLSKDYISYFLLSIAPLTYLITFMLSEARPFSESFISLLLILSPILLIL